MQRRVDDTSFEGAWDNQFKEEQEKTSTAKKEEIKVHEAPVFRGQRDVVEKRTEIRMQKKKEPVPEKKHVEVVSEPSSKLGDDFDVDW